MTALVLRVLAVAWKPILAVLAALGLYAKGRADAATTRDLRDARDYQKTMERASDAPVHTDADVARKRMRERASRL